MRIREFVATIALIVSGAVNSADFPGQWSGTIGIKSDIPAFSPVRGGTTSVAAEGNFPIAVNDSEVGGAGDTPYQNDTDMSPCTTRVRGTMHYDAKGRLVSAAAPEKGTYLEVTINRTGIGMLGTILCPGVNKNFQWTVPPMIWDKVKVPLADGAEVTRSMSFGGKLNTSVKLETPCPGWDSRQSAGPKVILHPDMNTFPYTPPGMADYTRTEDSLSGQACVFVGAKECERRIAARTKTLGFTIFQKDFPRSISVKTAPGRNGIKECISVDTVEVTIPLDSLHVFAASEIRVNRECSEFIEKHEAKHHREAWETLRAIASEIETSLRKKFPGPYNSMPSAISGAAALQRSAVEQEIAAIIDRNINAYNMHRLTVDASDYPAARRVCGAFL